jgi:hypothetical protein
MDATSSSSSAAAPPSTAVPWTMVLRSRVGDGVTINKKKHRIDNNNNKESSTRMTTDDQQQQQQHDNATSTFSTWQRSSSLKVVAAAALGNERLNKELFQVIYSFLSHRSHCSLAATNYIAAITSRSVPIHLILYPYDRLSLEQFRKWSSRIISMELYYIPDWLTEEIHQLKRLVTLELFAEGGVVSEFMKGIRPIPKKEKATTNTTINACTTTTCTTTTMIKNTEATADNDDRVTSTTATTTTEVPLPSLLHLRLPVAYDYGCQILPDEYDDYECEMEEWLCIRNGSTLNGWYSGQCYRCDSQSFLVTCTIPSCQQPKSGLCVACVIHDIKRTNPNAIANRNGSDYIQCHTCHDIIHHNPSIGCTISTVYDLSCDCHHSDTGESSCDTCYRCASQCDGCHRYYCQDHVLGSCSDCHERFCRKCLHRDHVPLDSQGSRCTSCQRQYIIDNSKGLHEDEYDQNEINTSEDDDDDDDYDDDKKTSNKQREPNEPWSYRDDDDHIAVLPSTWKLLDWKHWRYHQYDKEPCNCLDNDNDNDEKVNQTHHDTDTKIASEKDIHVHNCDDGSDDDDRNVYEIVDGCTCPRCQSPIATSS